ncbi:MAG: hypothetical protein EPN17_00605 [Methylobacter sp.]|nr:MAG: hypothetical protein EPN17_00605 [Methylobacter sp.]
MSNETLITRIMGIAKTAIIDIESNYPNQLSYADSPEGGTAITGADSTLTDILIWLENNGHMHSVRRAGSRYFCERLFWSLQPRQ